MTWIYKFIHCCCDIDYSLIFALPKIPLFMLVIINITVKCIKSKHIDVFSRVTE